MTETDFQKAFKKLLAARPAVGADKIALAVDMKIKLEQIRARAVAEAVKLGTSPKMALDELAEPFFETGQWGPFDHNWPDDDESDDAFFRAVDDFNDQWFDLKMCLECFAEGRRWPV